MKTLSTELKKGDTLKQHNSTYTIIEVIKETEKVIRFKVNELPTIIKHKGCKPFKCEGGETWIELRKTTKIQTL